MVLLSFTAWSVLLNRHPRRTRRIKWSPQAKWYSRRASQPSPECPGTILAPSENRRGSCQCSCHPWSSKRCMPCHLRWSSCSPCQACSWSAGCCRWPWHWHHQEWPTLAWLESPKPWRKHWAPCPSGHQRTSLQNHHPPWSCEHGEQCWSAAFRASLRTLADVYCNKLQHCNTHQPASLKTHGRQQLCPPQLWSSCLQHPCPCLLLPHRIADSPKGWHYRQRDLRRPPQPLVTRPSLCRKSLAYPASQDLCDCHGELLYDSIRSAKVGCQHNGLGTLRPTTFLMVGKAPSIRWVSVILVGSTFAWL